MYTLDGPVIVIEAGTENDSKAQEIYRNLQVLYNTVAGEQALDRDFGIDANVTDYPQEFAQSMLAAEYVRKTEQYEPRSRVRSVGWEAGKATEGNMKPKVVVQIV